MTAIDQVGQQMKMLNMSTGKETKTLKLAFVKYFDKFAECRDNGCSIQQGQPKRVNTMCVLL